MTLRLFYESFSRVCTADRTGHNTCASNGFPSVLSCHACGLSTANHIALVEQIVGLLQLRFQQQQLAFAMVNLLCGIIAVLGTNSVKASKIPNTFHGFMQQWKVFFVGQIIIVVLCFTLLFLDMIQNDAQSRVVALHKWMLLQCCK